MADIDLDKNELRIWAAINYNWYASLSISVMANSVMANREIIDGVKTPVDAVTTNMFFRQLSHVINIVVHDATVGQLL